MGKKKNKQQKQNAPVNPAEGDTTGETPGLNVLQETAAEDPLAKFVQARWREMAVILLVVFAFLYGKRVFDETRQTAMERSADVLIQLQASADEYLQAKELSEISVEENADNKTTDEESATSDSEKETTENAEKDKALELARNKLNELVRTLSQERSPYKEISTFYAAWLTSLDRGTAADGGTMTVPTISANSPDEALLAEISQLVAIQGKIRADKPDVQQQALLDLKSLADSATYLGVPAVVLLARMQGEDSSIDVKEVASNLLRRQPEQSDLLRKELPELF